MPVATIRGVDIHYEILGERGPFVALQPGGRRAGAALRSLAAKIAEAGNRVIIYDRRNCGASGIAIEGESENDEWAEDLLDGKRMEQEGILVAAAVRRKWDEHVSGKAEWPYHLWDILMFQAWLAEWGRA